MIRIEASIVPVPFKRASGSRRRYNEVRYTDFKRELGVIARQAMRGKEMMRGAVWAKVVIYKNSAALTSPNWGDGDNFMKSVFDSLQGICFENDAQVVEGVFIKREGSPKIVVELENYEGGMCLVR